MRSRAIVYPPALPVERSREMFTPLHDGRYGMRRAAASRPRSAGPVRWDLSEVIGWGRCAQSRCSPRSKPSKRGNSYGPFISMVGSADNY